MSQERYRSSQSRRVRADMIGTRSVFLLETLRGNRETRIAYRSDAYRNAVEKVPTRNAARHTQLPVTFFRTHSEDILIEECITLKLADSDTNHH